MTENIRDFDGVWTTSSADIARGEQQVTLYISSYQVTWYIQDDNEPQQTRITFSESENVWYMLGGSIVLSRDGKELFRTGKSGKKYKFERVQEQCEDVLAPDGPDRDDGPDNLAPQN